MNQQKIIWGAIVFSSFIYVLLAYMTAPDPRQAFSDSVAATMTLALYGAAFACFLIAMVIPSLFVQSPQRMKMIVALAMFEACAIMGLGAAIIQHDWRLVLPAWVASLVGFMREFPRDEVSAPA